MRLSATAAPSVSIMQDTQLLIPASFTDLLFPPRPTQRSVNWAAAAQRYELCEDMAQLLCEQAPLIQHKQVLETDQVLTRMLQSLLEEEARLEESEALWVVCRLAELLQWPLPAGLADGLPPSAADWLERQLTLA